jgi:WD40 repeat protein
MGLACGARVALAQDVSVEAILRIEAGMHTARIDDAATDRAQKVAVTVGKDKTARVWTLPELQPVRVLRPPIGPGQVGELLSIAVAPDAALAAVAERLSVDKEQVAVDLFDLRSGHLVRRFKAGSRAKSLAITPDGRLLAAGLATGGVRVWRVADGVVELEDRNYSDEVCGIDFASDGRLAASSLDGDIRLYNAALSLTKRRPTEAGRHPFTIKFSLDGRDLAIGFEDKPAVEVRSAVDLSLRALPDVSGLTDGSLARVAWSTDGQEVIAGGTYPTAGNTLIFAWGKRGAGFRRTIAATFDNTLSAVLPLAGASLLVASTTPAVAVFAIGQRRAMLASPIADLRPKQNPSNSVFRISYDGTVVEVDRIGSFGHLMHLDAAALTVTQLDAPTPGLASWQPAVGNLQPRRWFDQHDPSLNGRPLRLQQHERSFAVDVRRDQVLLGTAWYLRLFNADASEAWPHAVALSGAAWRVAQSPNGRLVTAAVGDGTVRWYRASDGAELLAMFLHADGKRWVAFTPSGYYAASPGGEDLIGWQVNNGPDRAADFFPASRFRERFYRPDVVALVLQTLDETQAVKRAESAKGAAARLVPNPSALRRQMLEERPPVVSILSPQPGAQLVSDVAELEVEVRSPTGQPITRVEARLNARPAPGAQVGSAQATVALPGEQAERRHIVIPVPPEHEATLQVIGWSGEHASEAASLTVRGRTPPAQSALRPVRKPRLNGVLVGVSTYNDTNLQLKFAAKDAQDLAAALQKQKDGLYDEVNLRSLLIEGRATKQAILDSMASLSKQGSRYDTTVVFLAGHGKTEGGKFYFLPVDAGEENFRSRGLTGGEIKDLLHDVSGHILLFIDACYAGALAGSRSDVPVDVTPLVNELRSADAGLVVYGATGRGERAKEVDALGNGVFTRALLDVLQGKAGQDSDGAIHVTSLGRFLREEIERLAPPPGQHPSIGIPEGLGDPPVFMPR